MFTRLGWFLLACTPLIAQNPVSIGTFTPSTARWLLDTKHTFNPAQSQTFNFGAAGDRTITGDWNGDGRTKLGVYRSGTFYLDVNGNGLWDGTPTDRVFTFIAFQAGDQPVIGDWTGDGRTKIGIYRGGFWLLDTNNNGIWDPANGDQLIGYGGPGTAYVPVVGDWNGDGRAKVGYYNAGNWVLDYNGNGVSDAGDRNYNFLGAPTDIPVTGDWTGDGKTKIGIYRQGFWCLDINNNGIWDGVPLDQFTAFGGNPGEIPLVGDWNGDGRSKVGVFFGAGNWALDANGNGKWDGYAVDFSSTFGQTGDIPVTGKWSIGLPSLPNSLSIVDINDTKVPPTPLTHAGVGTEKFTFTYRDISGAANIQSGQVEFIDSSPGGLPRCGFQWQRPGILNMYATGASNTGTSSSDGFCTVTLNSISAVPGDLSAVAVTVSISFMQDYPGVYGPQTYGVQTQVIDANGFQTSWGTVGTWTVDQIPLGPWSGSGNIQTFTVSAADPAGQSAANINNVQLVLNWGPYLVDGCYFNYDAAHDLLFLADKTGNFSSYNPISLKSSSGTLGDLANANCQVNGSSSSVTSSGTSLYLNLKVTFSPTFIGQQHTYVEVSDTLANSQPVFQGTWTAYPALSAGGPTNILPSGVNNDGTGTTTFTFNDQNGFGYVPAMYIEIGQSFDNPANCFLIYTRGTGTQNHSVIVLSSNFGTVVGQGYVGQLGAKITSSACIVDLGSSSIGGETVQNGTRGALNLSIKMLNADTSGQVRVWQQPIDRQNLAADQTILNWGANPSPLFPVKIDDFGLGDVFTVSAQQTIAQGFTVPIITQGKFTGTVSFTCAGPGAVTITCSGPVSTSGSGPFNASFSVMPGASASSGTVTITATATSASGPLSHTLNFPLTVSAAPVPPSLTFSGNQTIVAAPYGSATFAMVVTGLGGWNSPVVIHTYPAYSSFDFCTLVNGSCITDRIKGNDITITPPATIFFRVTDRTGMANQTAFFSPSITSPGTPRTTGVTFTFKTNGSVPADFTLSAPTQVTIPAGGSVTSNVSITAQGSYTGTVSVSSTAAIASFAQTQLTVNNTSPTATTAVTFSAGSQTAGIHTESIIVGGHRQSVQVTVSVATQISVAPSLAQSTSCVSTNNPGNGAVLFNDGNVQKINYCIVNPTPGQDTRNYLGDCSVGIPNVTASVYSKSSPLGVTLQFVANTNATPGASGSVTCSYQLPQGVVAQSTFAGGATVYQRPSGLSLDIQTSSHDDPTNNTFVVLTDPALVYGGSEQSTSDALFLTASLTPAITGTTYTWSVTGPGSDRYTPPASGLPIWTLPLLAPTGGSLHFRVDAVSPGGATTSATRDVEVGVRTDDVILLGYIDLGGVPLPDSNSFVDTDVTSDLPLAPGAFDFPSCVARFYNLSQGYDAVGPSASGPLSVFDRAYILDWQFGRASNPLPEAIIPGGDFRDNAINGTSEARVTSYTSDLTHFKLFNRLQIKYRLLSGAFNGPPIVLGKSVVLVGQTPEPCGFPLSIDVPGQVGPAATVAPIITSTTVSQVNDGSPTMLAVAALNTLLGKNTASPVFWENIGSRITFTSTGGTSPTIYKQPYPTYLLYQNGKFISRFPEAVSPDVNFNSKPFPSGTYPCIIQIDPLTGIQVPPMITPGGRCGDMHSAPDVTARPSPYLF